MTRSLSDVLPLSPLQEGLLFLHEYGSGDPGSGESDLDVYTVQVDLELDGPLDPDALRASAARLLARHDNLRAGFSRRTLRDPVQFVPAEVDLPWEDLDLSGLAEDERAAAAAEALDEHRWRRFDVRRPPLLRFLLVRLGERSHRFALTTHHILLDGWSMPLVLRELMALYRAGGDDTGLPPVRRYRDYLAWLGDRDTDADSRAWRDALAGLDAPTLVAPGAAASGGPPRWLDFGLTEAESTAVTAAARRAGVTLNTAVQGLWGLVLGRSTGRDDVVYGITVSGRPAEIDGVERMVGLFVNTVPLRVRLLPGESLTVFLRRLQREQSALLDNHHHRLADVQRAAGHPVLFDSVMAFENYPAAPGGSPSGAERDGTGPDPDVVRVVGSRMGDAMHYPLGLLAAPGPPIGFRLGHRPDAVDDAAAARYRDRLLRVLRAFADDPDTPVGRVDVRGATERPTPDRDGRHPDDTDPDDTDREVPETTLPAMAGEVVARRPDHPAVTTADGVLTYAELDARANRLARQLIAHHGVGPERFVAVALPRSAEFVTAVLAVLKTGAAYLPIDPEQPAERVGRMLGDARPDVVVTSTAARPAGPDVPVLCLDDPDTARECADRPAHPVTDADRTRPVHPDHAAYAIYTSGSTGRPKGVVVTHRSIVGYLARALGEYPLDGPTYVHSPVSFDLTVGALFVGLLGGGGLRLGSLEDSPVLDDGETPPSFLKATPSHLPILSSLTRDVGPTGAVTFGGEALLGSHLTAWRERHPAVTVYNVYGPTETTVNCTEHRIDPGTPLPDGPVPIGRPLWNTELYVLDGGLRPVPDGVVGELYVAGAGLARGYLARPDATAERFVACPWGPPGRRMYRTGDLVVRDDEGRLVHRGRVDDQVQVRGFRVELGEVDAAMSALPGVARAVTVLREDSPGDQRLVGYVVPADGHTDGTDATDGLLDRLRDVLPAHMVPAAVVVLETLPLTPHGKVDHRALPEPEHGGGTGREPRSPREEILCALFAETLRVPRVGIDDDFFALGGHSLLATRLVGRIRAALDVTLGLRTLFEHPTVAALGELTEDDRTARSPVRRWDPRPPRIPLSHGQRRLWMLDRVDGASATYNIRVAQTLDGPLDADALDAALADVVARHEALRTVIAEDDEGPHQVVLAPDAARPALVRRDVDGPAGGAATEALAGTAARHVFDLARDLPLHGELLRTGPEQHVLVLVLHHIAGDGWSVRVLVRDLLHAYTARVAGSVPRWTPLPLQYADYALSRHEHRDETDARLEHWRGVLDGLPVDIGLPADRPRPTVGSGTGDQLARTVPADVHEALVKVARAQRASTFMVLQAALSAFLGRLSGTTDVALGVPVAGRADGSGGADGGLEDLVGFFVNTLVLRTDVSGDPTFTALVDRARLVALDAYAHQDVPFERLVEELNPPRSLARHPLFQVALNCNNTELADTGSGGTGRGIPRATPHPAPSGTAKFDLQFTVTERHGDDGAANGLALVVEYAHDLFDASTAELLADRFVHLLTRLVDEPRTPIGGHDLLLPAERERLTAAPRVPDTWPDRSVRLPDLVARHVAATPDADAVVALGGERLTYRELDRRSAALAARIGALRLPPETGVALDVARGPDHAVAALAVLRAGGFYVPLDPDLPRARRDLMLDGTGARAVVTDRDGDGYPVPDGVAVLPVRPDPASAAPTGPAPALTDHPCAGDRLAYVMYTSGSSGRPKGVAVTHHDVAALAADHLFDRGHERVLLHSPSAFDASTYEMWVPLLRGGAAVTTPAGPADPEALLAAITGERVGAAFVTTALFVTLADRAPDVLAALGVVLTGGEAMPSAAMERALARTRDAGTAVTHVYGPTETTTFALAHRVTPDHRAPAPVPIGTAMDAVGGHVLGADLSPVPPGNEGELYLSGHGLARGYVGRAALTAERFVASPFAPGMRMYRTGDRVRLRPDGDVEFVGRVDDQVKIHGFRIEPAETAAVLAEHPAVAQAHVQVLADHTGTRRLVGYVVAAGAGEPSDAVLHAHLAERLPAHQRVADLVHLPALPLNAHGKVDRAALPAPQAPAAAPDRAPRGEHESALCELVAGVLRLDRVGPDDHFFDRGGHSLSAITLADLVRRRLGVPLAVADVFRHPRVADLAASLGAAGHRSPAPLLTLRGTGGGNGGGTGDGTGTRPPLFCVHPAAGLGWCYAALLRHLPSDQPVYALQARGPADGPLPESVTAMARDYVRTAREAAPHGPYRLLGWSLGGHVAHAMAALLEADGEDVELLTILDAYPPTPHPTGEEPDEESLVLDTMRRAGYDPDTTGGAFPIDGFRAHLREIGSPLGHLDDDELLAAKDVYVNNVRILRGFRPDRTAAPTLFVTAHRGRTPGRHRDPGAWAPHTGPITVHDVDADHQTLLTDDDAAREVGAVLAERLEKTDSVHRDTTHGKDHR